MNEREGGAVMPGEADGQAAVVLPLFGRKGPRSVRLEVHTHSYISGPNANRGRKVEHSHAGGDVQHEHPHTGPARYVIDKDRWAAMTGLVGGGRKKYTKEPSGPQLEYVARTAEQDTFEIIVCESSLQRYNEVGSLPSSIPTPTGGGLHAAARMVQGHKMTPRLRIEP